MATTKTYHLDNRNQMIDLNGSEVNFALKFSITGVNNAPFYAVVVDQQQLDTNAELPYKYAENGTLSGNLVNIRIHTRVLL